MSLESDSRVSNGVAVLTLDNPPVNSLSSAQRRALHAQLQHASKHPDEEHSA
jgi:3-hydroxyacyl-CoA dehydrogenase